MALLPSAALSYADDRMIEGAKQCTRYVAKHEREHGIPVHLLAAIASTESGRWHSGLKMPLPWPWTINAEGKGQYFSSKQEAVNEVRRLQARGVKSIDVGCMQVNLYHHADAFANLNEAFDPKTNVAYAAKFLKNNYNEIGSWKKAAAAYHSRTPSLGNKYIGLVYNAWRRIINEVRSAKAVKSAQGTAMVGQSGALAATDASLLTPPASKATSATQDVVSVQRPAHKPLRMKVIELAKRDRKRENGVIVIRPSNEVQAGINDASVAEVIAEARAQKTRAPGEKSVKVVSTASKKQPATPASKQAEQKQPSLTPAAEQEHAMTEAAAAAEDTKAIRMQGETRRVLDGNQRPSTRKSGPSFIFD